MLNENVEIDFTSLEDALGDGVTNEVAALSEEVMAQMPEDTHQSGTAERIQKEVMEAELPLPTEDQISRAEERGVPVETVQREDLAIEAAAKEKARREEIGRKMSVSTANTWANPEIRAKRTLRRACQVTFPDGTLKMYGSVWEGFQDIKVPNGMGLHRSFRAELRSEEGKEIVLEIAPEHAESTGAIPGHYLFKDVAYVKAEKPKKVKEPKEPKEPKAEGETVAKPKKTKKQKAKEAPVPEANHEPVNVEAVFD